MVSYISWAPKVFKHLLNVGYFYLINVILWLGRGYVDGYIALAHGTHDSFKSVKLI